MTVMELIFAQASWLASCSGGKVAGKERSKLVGGRLIVGELSKSTHTAAAFNLHSAAAAALT